VPFSPDLISPAVQRYHRERDRYAKLADRVAEICRESICEQNAIRAQVTFRVKSTKSFEGKLKRFSTQKDKNYASVDDIFQNISDLAGVRIAAYSYDDCARLAEHIIAVFRGFDDDDPTLDRKDKKEDGNHNYYRAIHAQVRLPEEEITATFDNVDDIACEIQICSMMDHVWNEIEHDIGYKPDVGPPSGNEAHFIGQLGLTVRQGNLQIAGLLAEHEHRVRNKGGDNPAVQDQASFQDVHDFVSRMRNRCLVMPRFPENSGQLYDMLVELGLQDPLAVEQALWPLDERLKLQLQSFKDFMRAENPRLEPDPETSDLLLFSLLTKKPKEVAEALKGRAGRGRGRANRLHSLFSWLNRWKENAQDAVI